MRELGDLADDEESLEEQQKRITEHLKRSWLVNSSISDHTQLEKTFAKEFDLSLTDARKHLEYKLKKYEIEGTDIPKMVKKMRKYRRSLKGEDRIQMSKSIDNLIDGYANHLEKSIDNIYWLSKYKPQVQDMTCSEDQLIKLSYVDDENTRREMVDILCKYWEAKIDRNAINYNQEYCILSKEMSVSKRAFKALIKKHMKSIDKKRLLNIIFQN